MIQRSFHAHVILAVVMLAWAFPASAHDVWFQPPTPVAIDELVSIEIWVGHGDESAETVPRNERRIVRLIAQPPSGDVLELPGLDGSRPFGVLRPTAAGSWVVGYESRPFVHRLGAERFRSYLAAEGLDEVARIRRASRTDDTPGIEWVSRSIKTLFAVDGEPLVDRAIGLPVEIIAEKLPHATSDQLILRLDIDGTAVPGAQIDLRSLSHDEIIRPRRTDRDGRVRFTVGSGVWLATAVVSHQLADGEDGADHADWRTIFASWSAAVP